MTFTYLLPRWVAVAAISLFFVLLLLTPAVAAATGWQALALFDAFYRAGALVFGGGHVVLPLLQAEVVAPGWISRDAFLSGYGAAQAVGPLFTFAAYLGAAVRPEPNGVTAAAIALVAVFLPGLLLVLDALPFWDAFRALPIAQAAMRGAPPWRVFSAAAPRSLQPQSWTSATSPSPSSDLSSSPCGMPRLGSSWR